MCHRLQMIQVIIQWNLYVVIQITHIKAKYLEIENDLYDSQFLIFVSLSFVESLNVVLCSYFLVFSFLLKSETKIISMCIFIIRNYP